MEHTLAPLSRPLLRLSQYVLNPVQQRLADGCHLNRQPLPLIERLFSVQHAREFQVEGETLIGSHTSGLALKA